MKQISFVKDVETGDLYGLIIRDGDNAAAIGVTPHAKTWARWANHSKMLSDQVTKSLDVTLQKSDSFELTTKRLEVLKSRLPREVFEKVVENVDDDAMIIRGTRHKTMGARFVAKSVTDGKPSPTGIASRPISSFSPENRKAALEYKAAFSETQQKYSTLNIQIKKNRAIFDPTIGSGGGWRCPDGSLYGGQITDRFGRGCGGGLTRRIGRAIMNAGRRLDDLGETMDQRRTVRRAARVERQAARREKRKQRIARVSNSLESLAQALVGDYEPLEGITPRRKRRRRQAGAEEALTDFDVTPGARRRRLVPKKPKRTVVDAEKKKPSRKKRGEAAKPGKLTPKAKKATERLAEALVGDYEPMEGVEGRKKRQKRGEGEKRSLWQRFQDAIERFVARLIGDYEPLEGIEPRRERRRREVEDKIPEKKPKKPSPKPSPGSKKPSPKFVPGGSRYSDDDFVPLPTGKKKTRIDEIDAELKEIDKKRDALYEALGYPATQWILKPGKEKELEELDKRWMDLIIEKEKLGVTDPSSIFLPKNRPGSGKKKPKPSGTPKKTKAGKQYGGAFKTSESAKAKAVERSMESGKSLIVVKSEDGKFRIVDADRVNDDDSLTPLFSVTPEGGFVEWDTSLSFDDNMALLQAAIDVEEKDIIDELKPVPVEELDLELKKSKTGSFMPDGLNSIMVENHRKGADAEFRKAFHEERLKNWSFWKNQIGDDNFDGVTDAKGALALIDAHYKQVSETEPVDEALLGMLRAERKNFLAMWVPDEGMDEVNFYERFNYVNPKRRQAIVSKADLGGMLVGKKLKKGKEKPKKPNVDAPINPDQSVVPDPNNPNAPKTPDADLSVPGDVYEPDKVLNLGDKPGKQVMVYKDELQKNLILNSGTDQPQSVLHMADNDLEDLAAGSPISVLSGEKLLADSEKGLSDARQNIADKIKNGEDVTEADVANLIIHENNVKFAKYRLENAKALKAKELADAKEKADELAKKIEADKSNLLNHKNSASVDATTEKIELLADEDKLMEALKKQYGNDVVNLINEDGAEKYIALFQKSLDSQRESLDKLETDLVLKIEEGLATQADIDDFADKLKIYKKEQLNLDLLNHQIEKKKAAKVAGEDDGIPDPFNVKNPVTNVYSSEAFDNNSEYQDYQINLSNKFLKRQKEVKKGVADGSDDDQIYDFFGGVDADSEIDIEKMEKALQYRKDMMHDALKFQQQRASGGTYVKGDLDRVYAWQSYAVRLEAQIERAKELNKKKVLDNESDNPQTPDLMPDADLPDDVAEGLPEVDDMVGAVKEKIDNFKPTKATIAQAKTDLMDGDPIPEFESEEDIESYFGWLEVKVEAAQKLFEFQLSNGTPPNYAGLAEAYDSEEEFDKNLRYFKHNKALMKWIKDQKEIHKGQLPDPDNPEKPKTIDPDVPGESAGGALAQLAASVPNFNPDKQFDAQGNKVKTLDGQINHAEYGKDYIADLPANFFELPSEQQLAVLQQMLGKNSPELALGQLYKNYILRANGDKESLQILRDSLESIDSTPVVNALKLMEGVDSLQEVIDKTAVDLDEALDKLAKANDPILRLRAQRDVNTARNKYIAAIIAQKKDPKSSVAEQKAAFNELKKLADYLPEDRRQAFKESILNIKDVKSKPSDKNGGKGMLSTPDFDATALGSTSDTGEAIAQTIPVGNAGIYDVNDASTHVSTGGALSQVPDDFLRDSIVANMGEGKRFQPLQIHKGFNKDNFAVVDSVTGKKYIIKTEDRNHMGHIQEAVGAKLANELGFPTPGIRFGSPLKETDLPSAQKSAEGVDSGLGRTMVIEHLENQFPGAEIKSIYDVPASELSGESIARLMVLDRSMNYFDRTSGNMFVVKGPDNKWYLHPIDHGNAFRGWGGSSTEQAAGFTKVTKGDNVDLMGLVSQLPAEEREAWANALNKASRKFAKMDVDTLIGTQMGQQISDPDDASRLFKHVDYLKDKQIALDWDAMTTDALAKAGFTPEQIDDILTGGPELKKFAVGEGRATPLTGVPEMLDGLKDRNTGISRLYDGPDIEFSEIKVQKIKATSVPNPDGTKTKSTPASLIQFKLRGNSKAKIDQELQDPEGNGWTLMNGSGIPGPKYPTLSPQLGESKAFSFAASSQNTLVSSNGFATYYKVLPDGQVLVVTKPSSSTTAKNSYRDFAQVIIPGETKASLADDKVAAAMSAIGVAETSHPSPEQVREVGVRRLANVILGGQNVAGDADLNDLVDQLESQGIDVAELGVRTAADGSQYVGLSTEGARKLAKDTNFGHVHHTLIHAQVAPSEYKNLVTSILAGGSVNSGTDRYKSGIFVQGWSNPSDVGKGSADYLFTHPRNGQPGDIPSSFSDWSFYTPSETVASRLDHYSHPGDNCGDINIRPPLKEAMAYSGHKEMMVRNNLPATTGIWVVPDSDISIIKANLSALGVTDINGVPIDDVLVVAADAPAAYAKMYARLQAEGLI